MSKVQMGRLLLLLSAAVSTSVLPGCGERLVEFANGKRVDAGNGGETPDAGRGGGVADAGGGLADAGGGVADAGGGVADAGGGVADAGGDPPDAGGGVADAGQSDAGFTALTILSTDPVDGAMQVGPGKVIKAVFSAPMDPSTLTAATFFVQQNGLDVAGTIIYDVAFNRVRFRPTNPMAFGLEYTATVTTGAQSLDGATLASDYSWTFRIRPLIIVDPCALDPVVLGAAAPFAVLAGSTVTNNLATAIDGDLGVSPGTAVTGFPPGTITGALHAGDDVAAQAMADLTTAYTTTRDLAICPAVSVAGNIGGQTLPPGLYRSTSSLAVSSGDLTLDAQGDGDAVFIFQIASTFTTTVGRQVFLTGGARAANVFWQVGSSATLGVGSVVSGTIMADQAITLNTGATLNGRALAIIAAVALNGNVVVRPAP